MAMDRVRAEEQARRDLGVGQPARDQAQDLQLTRRQNMLATPAPAAAERQKLLSQLDQAKMQEQMNKAMTSLSETVGQDVPTLEEVRDKIESRYAKALGAAEVQGQTVESRMLEVEQASMDVEAQNRLDQIRAQMGIGSGAATDAIGTSATPTADHSPATAPTQATPPVA